ncbi:MAG: substrate-binding domain-containing protein [Bacilli bacterium]
MKRRVAILISALMAASILTGCGKSDVQGFDKTSKITVISREDGSGTRGAFTELFKLAEKGADGKSQDLTTERAVITQSTGVMLTSVSGDSNAVGYVSLGSLNDTVKALKIDGIEPTVDNIKNGQYKISRPFNIATKGEQNAQTKDFLAFITSIEGQNIVEKDGYVSKENTGEYKSSNPKGKITIGGSSSVTPVMEKLKEAYEKLNKDVVIEINQSDSTSGMNSVAEGICNIGMASRELKESEIKKGLKNTVIAFDGIAVIVNKTNTLGDLSIGDVKGIYVGTSTTWADLNK